MTDSPGPCPRCAELEAEVSALRECTRFARCSHDGPGTAWCEVSMPDGRRAEGWLCRPHQILLSARPAFALALLAARGGETGPCGWLVPAEEAMEGEEDAAPDGAPDGAPDLEEVPG